MRALEDLVNDVRDPRSRAHLAEAVRAYQAGALRAAIITTWVAVALDLVAKLRELAEMGEATARAFTGQLDNAIASDNRAQLTRIERELLDKCRDDFELIAAREHAELTRLLTDRHVCAHPAFVSPDAVFEPTPELVRAHLSTAVDTVLSHGPTPGRKAIERFFAEVRSASWPATRTDLMEYLRARYLDRGKEALRRNLAIVIVKGCLQPPDTDETVAVRLAECAHALATISPALIDLALVETVSRREDTTGLDDDQLLRLVGSLGDLDAVWVALPATSHGRVSALLAATSDADLIRRGVFGVSIANPDLAAVVGGRLAALSTDSLATVVAQRPRADLAPLAVQLLRESGGWRTAEDRMRLLILPLAQVLTTADLLGVHAAIRDNSQVREASGVPPMVESLFHQTRRLPGAMSAWTELAEWLATQGRNGDPEDWYAYPQLRRQVQAETA